MGEERQFLEVGHVPWIVLDVWDIGHSLYPDADLIRAVDAYPTEIEIRPRAVSSDRDGRHMILVLT